MCLDRGERESERERGKCSEQQPKLNQWLRFERIRAKLVFRWYNSFRPKPSFGQFSLFSLSPFFLSVTPSLSIRITSVVVGICLLHATKPCFAFHNSFHRLTLSLVGLLKFLWFRLSFLFLSLTLNPHNDRPSVSIVVITRASRALTQPKAIKTRAHKHSCKERNPMGRVQILAYHMSKNTSQRMWTKKWCVTVNDLPARECRKYMYLNVYLSHACVCVYMYTCKLV